VLTESSPLRQNLVLRRGPIAMSGTPPPHISAKESVRVIMHLNMFDLVGEDRDFVFQVIDECQQYESRRLKPVKY
jgi:hypothetical protein